jgi:hypothetical protein
MKQFYVHAADEERCQWSVVAGRPITITGLNLDGKLQAYEGIVRAVETGQTIYPNYPVRVTMLDSN